MADAPTSARHFATASTATPNTTKPPEKAFGILPQTLTLHSTTLVNDDTALLTFSLPQGSSGSPQVSGLPLTSTLLSLTWPSGSWTPIVRPYTPVSSSSTPGEIQFLIKKYPGGKVSSHMHSLKPGDTVRFVAVPGAKHVPSTNEMKPARVSMIAGGAGITPMLQLIRGILGNPDDYTRIRLLWGVNTPSDAYLMDEFAALKLRFPGRFDVRYVVSKADEVQSQTEKGRIDGALLAKLRWAPKCSEEKVYVCGPPGMEESLVGKQGVLIEMGYRKGQVVKF
ncbi:ferredoxin reductase-like protein [Pseudovirgaria hyperparasitica]|uniref:NADH-cytochrome b5 reductase n=1 Tax=Pseudovirgaria hyperparasitica TaxID=470096 RepID=A0A6A6W350_9PEZI|nr:ferredoxin reductase-like protein [Pseudovirgaria hyperparasitica]KAF2757282.1 ferredoxin reductase-like protein [Pseudovirgaria hyperparasitica]